MKAFEINQLLLVGSVRAAVALTSFSAPIFAFGQDGGGTTLVNEIAWEAMHEACERGDWQAMAEAAEKLHGEDFDYMPHHGYYAHDEEPPGGHWGQMGGHTGGGMMD